METASTYKMTLSSSATPTMHASCSRTKLVSRVTALVSSVTRVTTALATTSLVLLVIVVGGIVLRVTLHLLTVVKVLAFGLDELVGFPTRYPGEDVFGHSMVFGDTCGWDECVNHVVRGRRFEGADAGSQRGNVKAGWKRIPLASSCCWYFLIASKPAAPARTSWDKWPWLSGWSA